MSITPYISEAQELFSDLPSDLTLQEAIPVLARLAREHAFLGSYIFPLLEQVEQDKERFSYFVPEANRHKERRARHRWRCARPSL